MKRTTKIAVGSLGALAASAATLSLNARWRDYNYARIEEALLQPFELVPFGPSLIKELPPIARRYLRHAIANGTQLAHAVRLHTLFEMKLRPSDAHPTSLDGWETLAPPAGFTWSAHAWMGKLPVRVADYYANNEGSLRVHTLGIVPIARASGPDITRSARHRMAIETMWIPSMLIPALRPEAGIVWEAVDKEHARVTFQIDGEGIPLTLAIDGDGRLREVTMLRHGDFGVDAWQLLPYGVAVEEETTFDGYTIPTVMRGGWGYGRDDDVVKENSEFRIVDARFVKTIPVPL